MGNRLSSISRFMQRSPVLASSFPRSDGLSSITDLFMPPMSFTRGFWSQSCSLTFGSMTRCHVVEYLIALGKILKVRSYSLPCVFTLNSSKGIDSSLSDNFGRSIIYGLSATTTLVTVSYVGGVPFILAAIVLGVVYWNGELRDIS